MTWKEDLEKIKSGKKYNKRRKYIFEEVYCSHEELVKIAKENIPRESHNSVSSFTSWVFNLSHSRNSNKKYAFAFGRAAEEELLKERKKNRDRIRRFRDGSVKMGRTVFFEDDLSNTQKPFKICSLRINGKPLMGRPDLVMRDDKINEFEIYEIKATRTKRHIPSSGWPNLITQLWCYSWINKFLQASDVKLIGAIYKEKKGELYTNNLVHHQRTPRWNKSDTDIHDQCLELFEIYGGKFWEN